MVVSGHHLERCQLGCWLTVPNAMKEQKEIGAEPNQLCKNNYFFYQQINVFSCKTHNINVLGIVFALLFSTFTSSQAIIIAQIALC